MTPTITSNRVFETDPELAAAMKPVGGAEDFAIPFPRPPTFTDKLEERKYLKERLAAAFRIFAKYEFDEGVGLLFCRPQGFRTA